MSSTVIVVPREVFSTDQKIVIFVKFPELAVDYIEVFVGKIVSNLIDVLFLFEPTNRLERNKKQEGPKMMNE